MESHDVVDGEYVEASVDRTVDIWAHGAAHGVWKERIRRVEAGREERWSSKSGWEATSLTVDMVIVAGRGEILSVVLEDEWGGQVKMRVLQTRCDAREAEELGIGIRCRGRG